MLVALLTAVRLIFRDRLPTRGHDVPRRLGLPYGLTTSLIGIGGGILSNMIMTFHGRAIHESVATSAGVGVTRLGAHVAHHVSRRRLELCFASYLTLVCGQFGSATFWSASLVPSLGAGFCRGSASIWGAGLSPR